MKLKTHTHTGLCNYFCWLFFFNTKYSTKTWLDFFFVQQVRKTNQVCTKMTNIFFIQYKTALSGWDVGMWLSEMSSYSVDLQKVIQDLKREKKKCIKWKGKSEKNWFPCMLSSVGVLTMSWVVPIFLASSLRSIVLRYKYLLRSSPSRMFRTAFCRPRLSLCSILDARHKKNNDPIYLYIRWFVACDGHCTVSCCKPEGLWIQPGVMRQHGGQSILQHQQAAVSLLLHGEEQADSSV